MPHSIDRSLPQQATSGVTAKLTSFDGGLSLLAHHPYRTSLQEKNTVELGTPVREIRNMPGTKTGFALQ